jgi:SAM-dependent methyltransferase
MRAMIDRLKRPRPTDSEDDDLDYPWQEAIRFVRRIRKSLTPSGRRLTPILSFRIPEKQFVGWVPSPMRVVHRMLELAEIKPGELVYDLGCGDGRTVITAVQNYSARGVGIDVDPARIEQAKKRAGSLLGQVKFRRQNIYRTDLRNADVILVYLLPSLLKKLKPRLRNLKRGARIVSHAFEVPDVAAYKTARLASHNGLSHDIYAYRIPLTKK